MFQDDDVVITNAKRTAVGSFCGSLANISATDLGSEVIKQLLIDSNLKPEQISEVIIGQVLTAAIGQNPARQTAIKSGVSVSSPACTINQVCGSGLRSVAMAYQAIQNSDADIIIAGGQENMSSAPHAIFLRNGIKMGETKMLDTMLQDGLMDAFSNIHMGITAENIAEKYNITRQAQDEFSLASQLKAAKADEQGLFKNEIIPIKITRKKEEYIFQQDEFIRKNTKIEDLGKLRPAFKTDGVITAGNSSGINDGAAMVMMMRYKTAMQHNLIPIAKIKSWAHAGVDPQIMGMGPVAAIPKALQKAQWDVNDVDLFELNEAFAAQALAVMHELKLNTDKVNITGGAIAIGHPIGASGTRILVTLLHNMQRQNAKKGVASLCIGGGMGIALCVERFS